MNTSMTKKTKSQPSYRLSVLPGRLAVCRLDAHAAMPDWADRGAFCSVTRTDQALTVMCDQRGVPAGVKREGDWVGLRVEGPLDFSLIGVLASLATLLAEAGVALLATSTFDTDYLFVQAADLPKAIAALRNGGHTVDDALTH